MNITKGSTNVSVVIRIVDDTDGTPETAVVYNTTGIDIQYRREGAASTSITEVTLAALTTAHADGGFLHIGNGYYRVDVPDAAFATGVNGVLIHGTVTGMVVVGVYVQLTDLDLFDAVRAGLSALPNAAANDAGGLVVSDAGGLDIDALNTAAIRLTAARAQVLDDWINAGRLDVLLDAIKVVTDGQAATGTGLTAMPWNASWDVEVQSEVADALAVFFTSAAQLVDDIMDEVISSTVHNTTNSLGWRLKRLSDITFQDGTVNDASATTTSFVTDLTETDTDFYKGQLCVMTSGNLAGQARVVDAYNGTTKAFTFFDAWTQVPADTDSFIMWITHLHSAEEIADQVWNEATSGHATAGSTGKALTDILADTAAPAKNTAFSNMSVLMVDSTDSKTPKTGLTLGVTRSIDGGAFGSGTGTAAEIANGMYQYDASAADMNGDVIIFRFTGTAADDTFITVHTRP